MELGIILVDSVFRIWLLWFLYWDDYPRKDKLNVWILEEY